MNSKKRKGQKEEEGTARRGRDRKKEEETTGRGKNSKMQLKEYQEDGEK